jgi:hypothetical protein
MKVSTWILPMVLLFGIGMGLGCTAEKVQNKKPEVADKKLPDEKSPKVAQIVFVGQKEACECTRKRIDSSWDELQKVAVNYPHLPVQRLHLDTEASKVAPYLEMRSLIVAPGVYFLDETNGLIEMLQGEVTKAQIGQTVTR